MKIKVCGITKAVQAEDLGELGVDFTGFIFYEKSPRYVLNHLSKNEIKNIKNDFKKVGVFVNEDPYKILKIVDVCGLDMVQLHGDESPEYCDGLFSKVPVIKAFSVDEHTDIQAMIRPFEKFASYFLFDAATKNYGGSGKKFNWKLLKNQAIGKPFFLSGGIGADDVNDIFSLTQTDTGKDLFSLDINSKFEHSPGVKNIALIKEFVQRIKGFH